MEKINDKFNYDKFNPRVDGFLLMQRLNISPKVFRLRQVALFCFRIDVEKHVESRCDRAIIENIIGLIKYTPGSSVFVEILSSKDVPKPSEIHQWIDRNEKAAVELEQLAEAYMERITIKIKI